MEMSAVDKDEKQKKTSKPIFLCSESGCTKQFHRLDRLNYHRFQHLGLRFPCPHDKCSNDYANPSALKRHERNVHCDKKLHQTDSEGTELTQYKCTENNCERKYKSQAALKKHLKTFHVGKDYKCTLCDKEFRKSRQLKLHKFSHTGVQLYKCVYDNCDKSFMLASKLKRHLKIHQGYTCDVEGCNDQFPKWTLYQKHKKLAHARNYICETCSRVFKSKTNLKSHVPTHSETRTIWTCSFEGCPKFFYFEKNLKHHVSSTHEGKRHTCTHAGCEKEFKHRVSLMRHLKLHSPKQSTLKQFSIKSESNMSKRRRSDRGSRKKSAAALISGFQPNVEDDCNLIAQENNSAVSADETRSTFDVVIITCPDTIEKESLENKSNT